MKKIKYLSVILCMMLIPMIYVNAEEASDEIKSDYEEVDYFNIVAEENISKSYKVNGNSIIGGNNVSVKNIVSGIDMVFGNTVTYKSTSDYTLVAGNTVNVNGTTANDGFIFGNSVVFDEDYKGQRDLIIFANSVSLKGEISRDVTIYAASVVVEDAKIGRNLRIDAESIEIKDAEVNGTLYYNEDAKINISDKAIINAKETVAVKNIGEKSFTEKTTDFLLSYANTLVLFVALTLVIPALFKRIENKIEGLTVSKVFAMLGYGLVLLIVVPILSVFVLTTVIGIHLSLFVLALYAMVLCLSTILSGYMVGLLVWKKWIKKDINILLVGLIGISIIKVLTLIPVIGAIIAVISLLLALSIFLKLLSKDA